ncbi:MAG: metalloregulator ArsR/SmtB family transcription factor [Thaumarchaeota archaeon]|nr:metalloregulator ArsR/SmtB family transcription factor [Nitrososphaerota archaeon]
MTELSCEVAKPYALFFKALSSAARIEIINLLQKGPKNSGEISKELGFEQSMVSHHLACLSFCGFVKSKRKGKNKVYSLNDETVAPLLKIVDQHLNSYATNLLECEALKR